MYVYAYHVCLLVITAVVQIALHRNCERLLEDGYPTLYTKFVYINFIAQCLYTVHVYIHTVHAYMVMLETNVYTFEVMFSGLNFFASCVQYICSCVLQAILFSVCAVLVMCILYDLCRLFVIPRLCVSLCVC
jgi:hypothetical protein